MMDTAILEKAFEATRARWPDLTPRACLILGSGWGSAMESFSERDAAPFEEIPGMGTAGVPGHAGRIALVETAGAPFLAFIGRRHWYEGAGWTPIAAPVYIARRLGARVLLLTNSSGGIREDAQPGDLMVIADHINQMGVNPLLGPHDPFWGPRFPDQSEVYDARLRELLQAAAAAEGIALRSGVYVATTGPVYETPAEIRAYRDLGADAVGMSTVPEAMLGHAAGLRVAGLSCITNPAAGIGGSRLSHEDVTAAAGAAMQSAGRLLRAFCERVIDEAD